MTRSHLLLTLLFSTSTILSSLSHAQSSSSDSAFTGDYEDYQAFETDPIELDQEVNELFGRFFQSSMLLGTGIFTGGLGRANTAGFDIGMRFVYYFDRVWAAELSGSWIRHNTFYNKNNTDISNVDIRITTTLIPVQLGIRYAFDVKKLPRSIALMNPYLAGNAELIFRSEAIQGTPDTSGLSPGLQSKYASGAINNSQAYGINLGGGMEFDVYRSRLYLGLDVRYHMIFWSDSEDIIGAIDRRGHYVTVLGALTYNY